MNGFSSMDSYHLFVLLLTCHLLSDYYFQSQKMADKKDKNIRVLAFHILLVGIPLFVLTIIIPSLWWKTFLVFLSHALIDYFKPILQRLFKLKVSIIFVLDQVLHLAIIYGLSNMNTEFLPSFLPLTFLKAVLFILLVGKPTNIAFRILFGKFQPETSQELDTIDGAGAMIGFLERLVIGACLLYGQFASIGLVFTAKSIARYNKISESPAFAEYYLIGSLVSILSALLAAWIGIK